MNQCLPFMVPPDLKKEEEPTEQFVDQIPKAPLWMEEELLLLVTNDSHSLGLAKD